MWIREDFFVEKDVKEKGINASYRGRKRRGEKEGRAAAGKTGKKRGVMQRNVHIVEE